MAAPTEEKTAELIGNASQQPTETEMQSPVDTNPKTTEYQQTIDELDDNREDLSTSKFHEFVSRFNQESVYQAIEEFVDTDYQKQYPSPFIIDIFPADWHGKAVPDDHGHRHWNFKIRCARMVGIILVSVVCLVIATAETVGMAKIIGSALLAMFTLYFSIIFWYVFSPKNDKKLYRVYSVSDQPKKWISLKTGYVQLIYGDESIQSISELSAINGGVTKTMLNTIGAYTWAGISTHFAGQLYYNRCIFSWDIVDILEAVGTAGLLLISLFELDPFRLNMKIAHYVGAALGCGTIAGYCIQQYNINQKFPFAIIIAVVACIAFVLWQLVGIATDVDQIKSKAKYKPEYLQEIELAEKENREVRISRFQCLIPSCFKKRSVNAYSRMNIGFEALFLYLGALTLCLWLIEYDTSCKLGCAGDYNEEIRAECTQWYYDDFYK